MYEWSEQEQMIQAAVRSFVDTEIRPHVDDLEHGDMPPYDLLRKMFATFGIGAMLTAAFDRQIARAEADEEGIEASRAQGGRVGLGHTFGQANPMRMAPTVSRVVAEPPSEDDPNMI